MKRKSIKRLFDILLYHYEYSPQLELFRYKKEGIWTSITVKEFVDLGNQISLGLLEKKVKKGDHVALISNNRWEWHLLDFAISQIGAICVPLYPTLKGSDYQFIFKECKPKIVFAANQEICKNVQLGIKGMKKDIHLYAIEHVEKILHFKKIIPQKIDAKPLEQQRIKVSEKDILTIIYTSGTEGNPKGVVLTHHNILSNIRSLIKAIPELNPEDIALTFLPLNHIYEKTVTYIFMYLGIQLNYAESMGTIVDNIKEVRPTVFTTIPLLMNKIYNRILEKGRGLHGIKRSIFFWAVSLTRKWVKDKESWSLMYKVQHHLADKLIYSKWREALGGRVRIVPSGSAAINPVVIEFFQCAGIGLIEGYGLTETSPVVAVNRMNASDFRLGTVGPVLNGVEVKIDKDGEILVKGAMVMQKYFKRPQETKSVFTKEGWFRTGDIGEIVDGKFLKITDRKKEIFKLSGGKYVAPQLVEIKLKESPFIEHAIVVGANQDVAGAIIQPHWEALQNWARKHQISFTDNEHLIFLDETKKFFGKIIDKTNQQLHFHEQIRRFELIPDTWSIATNELTPTMKIKRRIVMEKYKKVYIRMMSKSK